MNRSVWYFLILFKLSHVSLIVMQEEHFVHLLMNRSAWYILIVLSAHTINCGIPECDLCM